MDERPDFDLLAAWARDDREAGNTLVERHMRSLYTFFTSKLSSDVDELIQRTWLSCIESRDRYAGTGVFRAYLFGIARNELHRHFRLQRRDRGAFDATLHSVEDLATSPSQIVGRKAEHRLLLQALRRVPLDYQIVLELSFWEGFRARELAEVLGVSEPGARSRLKRAKDALADAMRELASSKDLLESTHSDLAGWATGLRDYLREAEGLALAD